MRAIETVRADPNLARERTVTSLHRRDPATAAPSTTPAWFAWIAGLLRWLDQSARLLLWGAAVLLAGLSVVYIARAVRQYRDSNGDGVRAL